MIYGLNSLMEATVMMELGQYHFSERYGWVEDKYGVSWQLNLGNDSQIIAPCLMYTGEQQGKAEEAINYYMSVFKNSAVEMISKYTEEDEGPTGAVNYAAFSLNGQNFKAMDSGIEVPYRFNPGISLCVNCNTQQEIDYFWDRLSQGGDERAQQCGWLADRYGVSWQVVPEAAANHDNRCQFGENQSGNECPYAHEETYQLRESYKDGFHGRYEHRKPVPIMKALSLPTGRLIP